MPRKCEYENADRGDQEECQHGRYLPRTTQTSLLQPARSLPVQTETGAVFSAPIALEADGSAQIWTLLISYPRAPIEAPIRHLTIFLSVVMVLVVAVAALLGILITHYLARQASDQRDVTG